MTEKYGIGLNDAESKLIISTNPDPNLIDWYHSTKTPKQKIFVRRNPRYNRKFIGNDTVRFIGTPSFSAGIHSGIFLRTFRHSSSISLFRD